MGERKVGHKVMSLFVLGKLCRPVYHSTTIAFVGFAGASEPVARVVYLPAVYLLLLPRCESRQTLSNGKCYRNSSCAMFLEFSGQVRIYRRATCGALHAEDTTSPLRPLP